MKFSISLSLLALFVAAQGAHAESFDSIAAQKQVQQGLSNMQNALKSASSDEDFKKRMITLTLERAEKTRFSDLKFVAQDANEKVELMKQLDPQTIKDGMIADLQEAQTSGVYVFQLSQLVAKDYSQCKRISSDSCAGAIMGTVFFPVVLALDLISLPFTFLVSCFTGF